MADNETTEDIIAEMRRGTRLPGYWRSCTVNEILQYHADRLEAAHRPERGDAAKLREALVQAELFVGNIVRHGHQTLVPGDKCTACDGAEELRDMICAALAEPVRNCDVYTSDELRVKFNSELASELPIANEHEKNLIAITAMGVIDTLLAPATEKEGGDDGNK